MLAQGLWNCRLPTQAAHSCCGVVSAAAGCLRLYRHRRRRLAARVAAKGLRMEAGGSAIVRLLPAYLDPVKDCLAGASAARRCGDRFRPSVPDPDFDVRFPCLISHVPSESIARRGC